MTADRLALATTDGNRADAGMDPSSPLAVRGLTVS